MTFTFYCFLSQNLFNTRAETFQGHLFPAVLRWRCQQHFKSYTVKMVPTTSTLHTTPCVNLTTKMGTKQTSYLTSSKYVYIKMLVFHTIIKYWKGALSLSVVEKNYQPLSQCDSVVYWYFSEGYKSLIHESGKNKNISLSLKLWQYKHQTETFSRTPFPRCSEMAPPTAF